MTPAGGSFRSQSRACQISGKAEWEAKRDSLTASAEILPSVLALKDHVDGSIGKFIGARERCAGLAPTKR